VNADTKKGCQQLAVVSLALLAFMAAGLAYSVWERSQPMYEANAIGALKTLQSSQTLFREGDKEKDGLADYATLNELSDTTLVDGVLGSGRKQGYVFTCRPSLDTPELLWFATANPERPGESGDRYFCTNHDGIIYYTGRLGRSIAPDAGGVECSIPAGLAPVGK
jgi:hypothetical protein